MKVRAGDISFRKIKSRKCSSVEVCLVWSRNSKQVSEAGPQRVGEHGSVRSLTVGKVARPCTLAPCFLL